MTGISVAMATYNGARFVSEQLESVARQSRLPDEVIICDDRSPDETVAILERFAETAPFRVLLHRNEAQLGYRLNFKKAVSFCTGTLIAFSDQDDVWHPDKLKLLGAEFDDPKVMLAYSNAWVTDDRLRHVRLKLDKERESKSLALEPIDPFKYNCYGMLQMFRGDLRKYDDLWSKSVDHNAGSMVMAHDQWYYFLAQLLGEIRFVDVPLVEYRQHSSNLYGIASKRTAWSRLMEKLQHHGAENEWHAAGSRSRAEIARTLADAMPEAASHLLLIASEYETIARRYDRRFKTYSAPSAMRRAGALASSIAHGDYGSGPWRFDRRAIAREMWSGVIKGTI
jgi:glycosyltransferase involved in cell wall biosynthesis